MKVKELMAQLSRCDGEAEVFIADCQKWSFEDELVAVVTRAQCVRDDCPAEREFVPGTAPGDVLLVEGEQLRCGEAALKDAVRRQQKTR